MAQKCTYFRMEIVLNTKTLEVGSVTCDPFGGLYRKLVNVEVNTCGGEPKYRIDWNADHCLSLGFNWSAAWLKLTQLRMEGWPLTDPRTEPVIQPEYA